MDTNWNKLKIFYTVAKVGSILHAAEELHISSSALSRQISSLEETLGSPLFHRHNRGVQLTGQGQILYRTVSNMIHEVDVTLNEVMDMQNQAVGTLRVSAPVSLGAVWLIPIIKEILNDYPKLHIDLAFSDYLQRFDPNNTDAAITLTKPREAWLICVSIMEIPYGVFAHKDYIAKHKIKTMQDYTNLDHIAITQTYFNTGLNSFIKILERAYETRINPTFICNNGYGAYKAVEAGIGIGCLPLYLGKNNPDIQQLEIEVDLPTMPVYLTFPEELRHLKRINTFKEYLKKRAYVE